jgi:DNA polymerase III delta subunit
VGEIATLLEQASAGKAPPIVLIEGDEYLARTSARELADAIVPEKERALNLIVLDAAAGAREIASHLMTVAMFAAPKAVIVEGADAFAEEVDAERELSRARDLWQGKRSRDAARRLLKLVRPAGWGAADLALGSRTGASPAKWRKDIGAAPQDADKTWLQELSAYALEQNLQPPPEDLEVLVQAIGRGVPPRTHLILVAGSLPPKHALVRLSEEKGAHVKRRAERRGRTIDTLDISPIVADELGPLKKRIARDAETELKNRLGDDLRLIASELRKLALYAGDRAQITREDVEAIVAPVREEEFFALAEAVGEGDAAKALQLFGDELRRKANASAVALPFLGGVASAIRKALADSARYAGTGARELGFNEYQAKLFPTLEEELTAKSHKIPHPFVAWLGYKRSRRRPRAFWRRALVRCAEVDFELKNGADPRLCIERLVVEVCAAA